MGINVPSVLNSKFGFTTECTTAVPPARVAAVEAIDEKYLPWREKMMPSQGFQVQQRFCSEDSAIASFLKKGQAGLAGAKMRQAAPTTT